jgi:hypothetical protein
MAQYWFSPPSVTSGPTSVLLTFRSSRAVPAELVLSFHSSAVGSTAAYSAEVDVGNDSTVEFRGTHASGSVELRAPIVLTPQGLAVRYTTRGHTGTPPAHFATHSYRGAVTLWVRPLTGCTTTSWGLGGSSSCGHGVSFSISTSLTMDHELELRCLSYHDPLLLGVGLAKLAAPQPWNGCLLRIDPLVIVPFPRGTGTSILTLPVPRSIRDTVHLQAVSTKPGGGTSHGLTVDCR